MAGQDESRRRHPRVGSKRVARSGFGTLGAWSIATIAAIAVIVCLGPITQAQHRVVPIGEAGTPYAEMELGRPGGTLRLACLEGPATWNDVIAYDPSTSRFTNLMFRGLVSVDPVTGELFGDLAASWEVSEDGLTVTFHLREGVWWSDGMPFTAHDVLFTYNDLILDEDVDAAYRQRLYLPDDTFPMCEKIDDYTVRFILSAVFRPILNSLAFNIMPKHKLAQYVRKLNPSVPAETFNEAWGLSTDPDDLCAIGPYKLEELYPRTHSRDGIHTVVMVRNPKYYAYDPNGVQLPYFERVEYMILTNEDVALLKFRNGEIDCLGMRPTDVPILLPESDAKGWTLVATEMPTYEMIWFYVNQDIGLTSGTDGEKRELYRIPEFRRALALCADKESMVEAGLRDLGAPLWSPVPMASLFYGGREYYSGPIDPRLEESMSAETPYNPAAAERILDELGVVDRDNDGWRDLPSGETLEIVLFTSEDSLWINCATVLQDDLRAVGINCYLQHDDFAVLWDWMRNAFVDAALFGLSGGPDPNDLAAVYRSSGPLHFCRLSAAVSPDSADKEIDELFRLAAEFSGEEALAVYSEMQRLMVEKADYVYLASPFFTYAYYNDIGNAHASNAMSAPDGTNGRLVELLFWK